MSLHDLFIDVQTLPTLEFEHRTLACECVPLILSYKISNRHPWLLLFLLPSFFSSLPLSLSYFLQALISMVLGATWGTEAGNNEYNIPCP